MPLVARSVNAFLFFFFNDTATTEIYTLSLHDALPILVHDDRVLDHGALVHPHAPPEDRVADRGPLHQRALGDVGVVHVRSEEHTSELQSPCNLVCRLLLEKKNTINSLQPLQLHPPPHT